MSNLKTDVIHPQVRYFSSLAGFMLAVFMLLAWNIALGDGTSQAEIPAAHNLSLKDMQGNNHTLHDYAQQGKWLVVMVWQSDCHVCNQEAEGYVAWYEKNKTGNSTLLGISTDGWENKEAAQGFLDEHKVTFPSLLVSMEALNEYYLSNMGEFFFGTPSFLIYSPAGELKAAQTGAVPTDLIDKFIRNNSQQAHRDRDPKVAS